MNKNKEEHLLLVLRIIEAQTEQITFIELCDVICKDKELHKQLGLTDAPTRRKDLGGQDRSKLNSDIKKLVKNGLLLKEERGHKDILIITEQGKKAIIQSKLKDDTRNTLLPATNKSTNKSSKSKEKSQEQVKEQEDSNYISWTNPEFVQENNRWEFYKKDQGEQVLEIYSSESEEELREIHKSKVMSHIMAAIHETDNKKEEEKQQQEIKALELGEGQEKPEKKKTFKIDFANRTGFPDKGDTSQHITKEYRLKIMKMKLEGAHLDDIIVEIRKEYKLTSMSVAMAYAEVLEDIRTLAKEEVNKAITNHMDRYEYLFKWFNESGYSKLALKAMERKEKLLGLSGEEVLDNQALNILSANNGGQNTYLFEKLTKEEVNRLKTLVRRTMIVLDIEDIDEVNINKKNESK